MPTVKGHSVRMLLSTHTHRWSLLQPANVIGDKFFVRFISEKIPHSSLPSTTRAVLHGGGELWTTHLEKKNQSLVVKVAIYRLTERDTTRRAIECTYTVKNIRISANIFWRVFHICNGTVSANVFIRKSTVPLKCGKLATKYRRIYGYFSQCMRSTSSVSELIYRDSLDSNNSSIVRH